MAQKRIGRPPSPNTMTERLFVRVDEATKAQLRECTKTLNMTRSDVVRKGIRMVQDSLKK